MAGKHVPMLMRILHQILGRQLSCRKKFMTSQLPGKQQWCCNHTAWGHWFCLEHQKHHHHRFAAHVIIRTIPYLNWIPPNISCSYLWGAGHKVLPCKNSKLYNLGFYFQLQHSMFGPFVVVQQNSLCMLHSEQELLGSSFAESETQILHLVAVIPFCLDKSQAQYPDLQLSWSQEIKCEYV